MREKIASVNKKKAMEGGKEEKKNLIYTYINKRTKGG